MYLQWRSTRPAPALARTSSIGHRTEKLADGRAASKDFADNTASEAGSRRSVESQRERWLTPKRMAFPPLSGIAAGLIVVLLSAWLSGNGPPTVNIVSPRHGYAVSQQRGFQVVGRSHGLGNETLWLTDYDGYGYAVDSEATIAVDGTWKAADSQLGDPRQHLPFALTARVIIADVQCATKLQAALNSNQDYLTGLPGGCRAAGSVTVEVTSR